MTPTGEPAAMRVAARDGTGIAYWRSGDGPPLVLVHGTTADHSRWRPLLAYLEPHVTVYAMDRRGRGASGDGHAYAIEREFEDVAAVVDAAAGASGSGVDVLGHSFGGVCSFGAAALTPNIRRLALYEGWPSPDAGALALPRELEQRMAALLAEGERERALEAFVREILQMPDREFDAYRAQPTWQARIAAAHTIARESRAVALDPEQARRISLPVLLLVGEDSPDSIKAGYETVAAALPDARVVVLKGQRHIAIDLVPDVFAAHVLAFLGHAR
jgi:pimeloyl-ACP methyl ester carboxylesterase